MSEGVNEPDLEAQGELSMARLALDDDEVSHAASHVANALACGPSEPIMREALTLLTQLHTLGVRALEAFPPADHEFLGAVVARAHLLAAEGRVTEAVPLLFNVAAFAPAVPWGVAAWLTPELGRSLDPDTIMRLSMQLASAVPEPAPDPMRAALAPFVQLVEAAALANPRHSMCNGAASALIRRCGDVATAIRVAHAAVAADPSMMTEMWLAYAHRAAGDPEQALAAMYRSSAHDPSYLPMHADIASTLNSMGRLDEAIAHAERASSIDQSYDCIVYTLGDLRYQKDRDLSHLVALADYARTQPKTGACTHDEVARNCADQPWLGYIPDAAEAVTNVLAQLLQSESTAWRDGPVRLTLSDLEVPSAMSTARRIIPQLDVEITVIGSPDIRNPVRGGRQLWSYQADIARPAVPAPDPAVARAVAAIADPRLGDPTQAYDRAVALAGTPIEQLTRCLVHPPMPSVAAIDGKVSAHPAWWARSNQVFACLGILHQHAEEPWQGSQRRAALVDILWGQEDWTTEAAAYALVVAAWMDRETRADVVDLIGYRLLNAVETSKSRVVTIRESLARLALATPGMIGDVTGLARDILAEPSDDPSEPAPRRRAKKRWFGRT